MESPLPKTWRLFKSSFFWLKWLDKLVSISDNKLFFDTFEKPLSIKDAEEEDYGVFDEVEEKSPEDYIELEKITSVAVNQFIDGEVKWRKKENIV